MTLNPDSDLPYLSCRHCSECKVDPPLPVYSDEETSLKNVH